MDLKTINQSRHLDYKTKDVLKFKTKQKNGESLGSIVAKTLFSDTNKWTSLVSEEGTRERKRHQL